jgi:hypothetical protein
VASVTGTCLRGGVRVELARRDGSRLLQGEELVRVYRPGGGTVKTFCSVCGSSLFGGTWPDRPEVSIRFGALDDEPDIGPQHHSHTASAAPWFTIPGDGLPRHTGTAPR